MKKRKLRKGVWVVLGILIVLLAAVGGSLYFLKPKEQEEPKSEIPVVEQEETPKVESANLTIVGDLLFEQPFYNFLDSGGNGKDYFQNVEPIFQQDDMTIGNMEVVIGTDDMEMSGVGYSFCAPESIGNLVSSIDLDVLSTANNHTYDRGLKGIQSTINYFKKNTDILTVGTYLDEDLQKDKIKEINGITFGFLSYTYGTNVRIPVSERQYVGLYREPGVTTVTEEYKKKLQDEVSALQKKVDVVIVMMHWGKEFTYTPSDEQIEMAHLLNKAGADIIIGNHSHSIEPIGWIGTDHVSLVYYSLGNFVSADNNITRTSEEFNNAYQFGLLSTLQILKEDDKISINHVTAEPIINYYDKNFSNFELIPLTSYDEEKAATHNRYAKNFTKEYVSATFEKVVSEEFRNEKHNGN